MASCTEWKTKKSGQRYCRIHVSRGTDVTSYTEIFEWPTKADGSPVAKTTADSALKKRMTALELLDKSTLLTKSERKARQKAEDEEAERQAKIAAAKIITLRQYGERVFLPAKQVTCAKKTKLYYENALKHLNKAYGDVPITAISSAQLTSFFLDMQKSSLSHNTILGIYVTANQLFKMAVDDDTLDRNPMDKVKRPKQKKDDVQHTNPLRYSEEEVKTIKKCLEKEPLKWQALVLVLLGTGMRRGEVCALRWDRIDFQNNEITVDGNLVYVPNDEQKVSYQKPKTAAGNRVVPMTKEVRSILEEYKAEQVAAVAKRAKRLEKDHKPLELKKIAIPEYVFTEKGTNAPMHPDSPNRYFSRFSKAYGISDFHPHKLRHTAISIMLDNGCPPHIVAKIVGHSDTNVLYKTYAHADKEGMRSAIDILERATIVS